jgi:acyl-CoA synthetase (NDP forming)
MNERSGAARLDRLMRPRSVAIVGISAEPGSTGGFVLSNLERCGYSGDIHLVSRSGKKVNGRPTFGAIDELPSGTDVAVLAVPRPAVGDAIAACGRRQIGAAVVFASGFAELDEAGRAEQEALTQAARQAGMVIAGPNCMGLMNFIDRVVLSFEFVEPQLDERPQVAVIAQSGALASSMRLALNGKGLGVSYSISTGNEADLGIEDFFAFMLDDPHTRAIVLFVEQIRRPPLFLALAAQARTLGKPIMVMHPGRSRRARESAVSHTGALTGDYAVMAAHLRHEAVVLVETLEELIDTAELLVRCPVPTEGAAILTNSGAVKGFALDFCDQLGLELPKLAPATLAALKAALPPYAILDNPVDVTAQGMREPSIFTRTAQALIDDPGIGSLGVLILPGGPVNAMDKAHALVPVLSDAPKPVVLAALGDESPVPAEFVAAFRKPGIPFFRSPERAMRALALATFHGRALHAAKDGVSRQRDPLPAPPGRGVLLEYLGKSYLAALGIPIPEGALAQGLAQAQEIAAEIGYPVVLKAQSRALAHKSDVGGVMLGIDGASALAAAWQNLQENLARSGVPLEGILVESMARPGVEMIVGARRDPDWGPVIMVGLGGVWTEALNDTRVLPATLPKHRIVAEIFSLKGASLLRGLRGSPPADVDAVAEILLRVAAAIEARPEIIDIDINPLVVYAHGALALDALIVSEESRVASVQPRG